MKARRYSVVPIRHIDVIVTDDNSDQSVFKRFREKGLVII